MPLAIIFMGTPAFAIPCLEKVYAGDHRLIAVVTRPDRRQGRGRKLESPAVKKWADRHAIPVLQPEKIDRLFIAELEQLAPQVIVTAAYGAILPAPVLSLPPLGCLNVHASLLPAYRGAAPIQRAIINGETETGVTIQYMAAAVDSGDIILQEAEAIFDDDTAGSLHDRLSIKAADLLSRSLDLVAAGRAPRRRQDHRRATYAPMLTPQEELITWEQSSRQLYNLIRGLSPVPGAYTHHRGRRLKVRQAQPAGAAGAARAPGEVIAVSGEGVLVQTGDGGLLVSEVQPAGQRTMPAADYARGCRLQVGERFDRPQGRIRG